MNLTTCQSEKLLRERDVWITEACDRCGKLLGAVRWTRRSELGEWCSKECRDGVSVFTHELAPAPQESARCKRIGARPSGRPKKHRNNAEKCRQYRWRRKDALATRNTPSELTENAQLTETKNGCSVVHPIPPTQPLDLAPTASLVSAEAI